MSNHHRGGNRRDVTLDARTLPAAIDAMTRDAHDIEVGSLVERMIRDATPVWVTDDAVSDTLNSLNRRTEKALAQAGGDVDKASKMLSKELHHAIGHASSDGSWVFAWHRPGLLLGPDGTSLHIRGLLAIKRNGTLTCTPLITPMPRLVGATRSSRYGLCLPMIRSDVPGKVLDIFSLPEVQYFARHLAMGLLTLMNTPRGPVDRAPYATPHAHNPSARPDAGRVRVISARPPAPDDTEPAPVQEAGAPAHEHGTHASPSHRFQVRGHWRNQAYGPGWSLHRRQWIEEYEKGPEDKPLERRDTVLRLDTDPAETAGDAEAADGVGPDPMQGMPGTGTPDPGPGIGI